MGVRFECPAGHKLHVKAHLAGQRGICPECGVRFIVPNFSGGRVAEAPGSGSFGSGSFDPEASGVSGGFASVALESAASFAAGLNQTATGASSSGVNGAAAQDSVGWYVRPSSGGQFGPVDAATFQQWIGEGRVAADAWVWRTGWADWKSGSEAIKLFASPIPRLSAPTPVAPAPARAVVPTPTPSPSRKSHASAAATQRATPPSADWLDEAGANSDLSADADFDALPSTPPNGLAQPAPVTPLTGAAALRLKRRKANQRLTIVLAILAAALLVVLLIVLNRPQSEGEPAPVETPFEAPAAPANSAATAATGEAAAGSASETAGEK